MAQARMFTSGVIYYEDLTQEQNYITMADRSIACLSVAS